MRQDTIMRRGLTPDLRVAIAVYKLAHASPYRQLSEILGIGASTA